MKDQLFYPAVFEENEDGRLTVVFPDLEGCLTQGDNMEEGYKMAAEVLGMTITHLDESKRPIPEPSKPQDIVLGDKQFVVVVEFNLDEYRRRYDSKAVSKNCTIPSWMNRQATEMGINFSQVLQEALLQKIK